MDQAQREQMFSRFCEIIQQFERCMDDYLYVLDLENDEYYISKNVIQRFAVDTNHFMNATEAFQQFVFTADVKILTDDLERMRNGEKEEHNIQYRWFGKNRQPIWINCRGRVVKDEDGTPVFMIGCVNEIGKRPIADNVSGLLESSVIRDIINEYCRNWHKGFILRLGIDDFKDINEQFGMDYGDLVLRGVAKCITGTLSSGQQSYRVPSDEFLILDMYRDEVEAEALYNRIRTAIDDFIEENSYECVFTISGGVLTWEHLENPNYSEIMKISQFALRVAKKRGKNQVYIFRKQDYHKYMRKRSILRAVRRSVANNFIGFRLLFQPIVSAGTQQLFAAESLLRFQMPDGECIFPEEFLPVLEESGLMIPVGKWVLEQAIDMCLAAQKKLPEFRISVNLSGVQILKSAIVEDINQRISSYGIEPQSMIFELAESGYPENTQSLREVWEQLRSYGVFIAMDDFGAGYSNLQSIGKMTPHIVKLDRRFVRKALEQEYEERGMNYVIDMVHSLGLKICVVGIETKEELQKVCEMSPDYIQGYYYGKPCTREEFIEKIS